MLILTIILGILTFALCYLRWLQTRSRFAILMNAFPMPKYTPLIGHVMDFSTDSEKLFPQVRKFTASFTETFGSWSVYIGGVHIVTADDAEIVMSNMKYINKGLVYKFTRRWLGDGLLTSKGEKWQHRRKLLTPTFHFNILRKFVVIFGEHSNNLIKQIKDEESQKSKSNLIPLITHTTLGAICETAMGTKLNAKDKKQSKYLQAVYAIIPTLIERALSPLIYTDFMFDLSRLGRKQNALLKTVHSFTNNVIKERELNFKESDLENNNPDDEGNAYKKKRLAMLDFLISAKKNKNEIDDEGIREEVDTFMFEGHDTTAMALCLGLMELAHHKDVQDKIIEEMDEIFGNDTRPATYEDLQNMKYLEICIKECLRLHPSVPIIMRRVSEEIQLTHHVLPADCEILIHIYNIHRDPKVFPDPEKFDPERFLPENAIGRHPYAYIPFSAGPRNCIGQKFAMLELKSIMSSVFRNFTLDPVSNREDLRWAVDLVLRVNGPVYVKFNSRK